MRCCRHPTLPRQCQADISSATATLRQPQLSTPPSAGKTRSLQYQITVPIASRAAKTSVSLLTQPSSLFATDKSDQAPPPNPHRSTPPPSQTPPRFPPSRLFGRLPPCVPSRLCLAGVRKPLTIPDLRAWSRFDPQEETPAEARGWDSDAHHRRRLTQSRWKVVGLESSAGSQR